MSTVVPEAGTGSPGERAAAPLPFGEYLRLEGRCSVVLGVALVAIAALLGDWERVWLAGVVALVGSAVAVLIARRATASTVAGAGSEPATMAAGAVRRQTVIETVVWVVAVGAWEAAVGSSAEFIAGTGVASVAFGVVRARAVVPSTLVVARRRYLVGATGTRSTPT